MLVSFDIKLIRRDHKQRRNGEACPSLSDMFLVEPDKLDIKKNNATWFSIYHTSFKDFTLKRQENKCKADSVLCELADVANAL